MKELRMSQPQSQPHLDIEEPLHPSLEDFAQTVADILVQRYLDRKRMNPRTDEECSE